MKIKLLNIEKYCEYCGEFECICDKINDMVDLEMEQSRQDDIQENTDSLEEKLTELIDN